MEQLTNAFLVVDDDSLAARALSRVLSRFSAVKTATSRGAACVEVQTRADWLGFVVDLRLPDGNGLDVLGEIRQMMPLAPAVLLSGTLDPGIINSAFSLGARCLCKPCPAELLQQFAREAMQTDRELPRRLSEAALELATRHDLSPAQTQILLAAVRGADRPSIVAARHVSENTHKTQVRGILKKTRTMSLGELRDRVLRSVGEHLSITPQG